MTGWVQKAIAWQLLEHGVLSFDELNGLVDNNQMILRSTITNMLKAGLLESLPSSYGQPGVNRKVYALSRKGLELAVALQASDVEGLREPSDPLFKEPQSGEVNI